MAAASSGVTNSLSRAQIGQKELRFLILRTTNERRCSIVISVVRFLVRLFIDFRVQQAASLLTSRIDD